jgi:hypothetical protein
MFPVDHLDVNRLLTEWRWLCPEPMTLVARNVFGDLFLADIDGRVFWLQSAFGKLIEIAPSEENFHEMLKADSTREEWFAETDARAAAKNGLAPDALHCIGFKIPVVFAESGFAGNAYVADLYEQVSLLGDLHHQLRDVPDGGKVRVMPVDR